MNWLKKKEDFVVSTYALERYKKSDHSGQYDNPNLTDKQIELLFCDKENWDSATKNKNKDFFRQALLRLRGFYDGIVFYDYTQENTTTNFMLFQNCIFYNEINIEQEENYDYDLIFRECLFTTTDNGSIHDRLNIDMNASIEFNDCDFDINIQVNNCSELSIYNCKYEKYFSLENFMVNKILISSTVFNNKSLTIKNMNIKELEIKYSKGCIDDYELNHIEKCNLNTFESKYLYLDNTIIKNFEMQNCKFSATVSLRKECKISDSCHINNSEINTLYISDIPQITLDNSKIKHLEILGINNSMFINHSTINYFILKNLKNKDTCILDNIMVTYSIDFKFSSINKLAIFNSSFKELRFDSAFIEKSSFSQLKGLNEANEAEEISDKHFASKESLRFFEKVTKE